VRDAVELFDPTLEKAALGLGVGKLQRPHEGGSGPVCMAEPAQELPARRVEVLVAVEIEPIDDCEPRLGAVGFGEAMARFISTTGEPVSRTSSAYKAAISLQSWGSSTCSDAIAAWTTYEPRPPNASARSSS
jgi:hypothetical protein